MNGREKVACFGTGRKLPIRGVRFVSSLPFLWRARLGSKGRFKAQEVKGPAALVPWPALSQPRTRLLWESGSQSLSRSRPPGPGPSSLPLPVHPPRTGPKCCLAWAPWSSPRPDAGPSGGFSLSPPPWPSPPPFRPLAPAPPTPVPQATARHLPGAPRRPRPGGPASSRAAAPAPAGPPPRPPASPSAALETEANRARPAPLGRAAARGGRGGAGSGHRVPGTPPPLVERAGTVVMTPELSVRLLSGHLDFAKLESQATEQGKLFATNATRVREEPLQVKKAKNPIKEWVNDLNRNFTKKSKGPINICCWLKGCLSH